MQVDLQPPSPRRRPIEPPREPSTFPLPSSPASPNSWRNPSPVIQDESDEERQDNQDEDIDEGVRSPGLLDLPARKHGKTRSVDSVASSRNSSRSGQESYTSEPAPTRKDPRRHEWESRPRRETRDDFEHEPPRRGEPPRPQRRGPHPSGPPRRPRDDYDDRRPYYDYDNDEYDRSFDPFWRGTGYQNGRPYSRDRPPIRPPLIPNLPSGFSGNLSIGSGNIVGNNIKNVGNTDVIRYIDDDDYEHRSR